MDHCALDTIFNEKFDTKMNMYMLKRVVTLLQKPINRSKKYNGYEGKIQKSKFIFDSKQKKRNISNIGCNLYFCWTTLLNVN